MAFYSLLRYAISLVVVIFLSFNTDVSMSLQNSSSLLLFCLLFCFICGIVKGERYYEEEEEDLVFLVLTFAVVFTWLPLAIVSIVFAAAGKYQKRIFQSLMFCDLKVL